MSYTTQSMMARAEKHYDDAGAADGPLWALVCVQSGLLAVELAKYAAGAEQPEMIATKPQVGLR